MASVVQLRAPTVHPMRRLICFTGINAFGRRMRTLVQLLPAFVWLFLGVWSV